MALTNVLITGGNGFIGSHLAEKLLARNIGVTLFDAKFNNNTEKMDCEKIQGDILDYKKVAEAVGKKDLVVHLAAVSRVEWGQQDPEKCLRVNILGTLNVLESLSKENSKAVMVFGSSREVYGEPQNSPVTEEHQKNPVSVYGVSKLTAEKLLAAYNYANGLKYVILRFSNVYGSQRDLPERVIPNFMRAASSGKPLIVYGGKQVLDFTFIDDITDVVARVIEKAANRDEAVINQAIQFTSGEGKSILELAELIKKLCNSDSKIIVKERRSFDVSNFIGSYEKAERLLGYRPKHSLEDGLRIYKERLRETGAKG